MKSQLFIVAVIAVAALGINAYANTSLTAQSDSLVGSALAVGHVEMVLRDADGNIKSYYQGDNVVTNEGDACAAEKIFGDATDVCNGTTGFTYIGVINGTYTAAESDQMSEFNLGANAADNLMAIVTAVATVPATESSQGTDVTVVNSGQLFNFVDNENDTTIEGVILADELCATEVASSGRCTALPANGAIFATRDANLAVTGGDTLEVTWTITVGSAA